jgi:hypothetical protein
VSRSSTVRDSMRFMVAKRSRGRLLRYAVDR